MMTERKTITWIEATHGDPALSRLWRFLATEVERLAEGRVDVLLRHIGTDAGGIRTPANRLMNDAAILAAVLDAQENSDAIVLGCWGAPTRAVRAASRVPVSSLADGSVRAIGSLATRAVMVTVSPALVPIFEEDLVGLGATGFLADRPVRSYDPESSHADVVRAIDDPTDLIARFDAVARTAVDDGADAVLVGCGYLAPLFTHHGYTAVTGHPDVPVVDCNRLALSHVLQLSELADAGIVPSPRGYARPTGHRAEALAAAARRLLPGDAR